MDLPCRHPAQGTWIRSSRRTIHRLRVLLPLALAGLGPVRGAAALEFPAFTPGAERLYLQAVVAGVEGSLGERADGCQAVARLQSQLGNKEAAERWARRALAIDPQRPETLTFLAELLVLQDRMPEAVDSLRQAIALNPRNPGPQCRLGMALDRLGDREGARRALESAVNQAPNDAASRLVLGRLLLDTGEAKEAARQLAKACELNPNLSGAFYALAQAQSRLGDPESSARSLESFRQLKEREKTDLDARNAGYDDGRFMRALAAGFHLEVAGLLVRQQQGPLAEAHLRQALAIAPTEPAAYEMLGALLLKTGRLAEVRAIYEARTRALPGDAAGWVNLGTARLQLKEAEAGVAALKQALALDPAHPAALNNLARYYLGAREQLPEALALAQRLVTAQPVGASYDLLGWALYANGNTAEARSAAARAVELAPTNSVYKERLQRLLSQP